MPTAHVGLISAVPTTYPNIESDLFKRGFTLAPYLKTDILLVVIKVVNTALVLVIAQYEFETVFSVGQ